MIAPVSLLTQLLSLTFNMSVLFKDCMFLVKFTTISFTDGISFYELVMKDERKQCGIKKEKEKRIEDLKTNLSIKDLIRRGKQSQK